MELDEKKDDLTDWHDDSNKLYIFCFHTVLPESDANFAKNEGKVNSFIFLYLSLLKKICDSKNVLLHELLQLT